jgi:hypothetical protein
MPDKSRKPRVSPGLFRRVTSTLRLLPHFLIIGAQRSGTSFLFHYLCRHPNVRKPLMKEIHFFDLNFAKGMRWYQAHFPFKGKEIITGEASPYYLFYPDTPKRVAAFLPGVKIIILLRNPVDRAYSHYRHGLKEGWETLSFEEALDQEDTRIKNKPGHQRFSYTSRGIYADQLIKWSEYVPLSEMLILKSEQLFSNPGDTLRKTQNFLELPEWHPRKYRPPARTPYPPMSSSTRRRLCEFFKPHNERLYRLLGTDLGWKS